MGPYAVPRINLRLEEMTAALQRALASGGELPQPPLLPDSAAGQLAASGGSPGSASLPLRERRQLLALRERLAREEAATAAAVAREHSVLFPEEPPLRTLRGSYAAAARKLASWLAEYLAVQHRNKRVALKWWWCAKGGGGAVTPAAAEGRLAVCERDALLSRLDTLWAAFLSVCAPLRLHQLA
jgi:hypothetical protein